jgi:hypothetical protein
MFPLAGKDFPDCPEALASAIEQAIGEVLALPQKHQAVTVEGGDAFPRLAHVRIDLSGARLSATEPPPKPVGVGKRTPGVTVDRLEVEARPIHYEQASLDFDFHATGLRLDFDRDTQGSPLLVLADADGGAVDARIKTTDLEALLLAAAALAAKGHGVTVKDLELNLRSTGPRSVAADVRVTAKKMMMTGVLRVSGAASVDGELNATLSGLTCTGEGIIGGTAAAFLQQHLKKYEGRRIPLMAFSLGDLALRDLAVDVNGTVRVSAAFGKGGAGGKKETARSAKA